MAYVFNLYIDQGTDFEQLFSVMGDLTNTTITAKMRSHYSSNTAFVFTCSANAATNTISLAMNHVQTANIAPGKYVYDVEVYYNSLNTIQRALEGLVIVSPQITY